MTAEFKRESSLVFGDKREGASDPYFTIYADNGRDFKPIGLERLPGVKAYKPTVKATERVNRDVSPWEKNA